MRISKFLLPICAAALCAGFISARAQDNPAQAAARAALMEKMDESAPPQTPPPVLIDSSGVVNSATNVSAPPLPSAPPNSASEPMPSPPAASMESENDMAQKKAEAAARTQAKAEKRRELKAEKAAARADKKNAATVQPSASQPANLVLPPMVAPPLPIPLTTEQQLQALDAKYKADQISPQDYFKQREAILAQPDSGSH
jgi:hypothetical protein